MSAPEGLDVSVETVAVCLLLEDGSEPVGRWEIPNSRSGAETLSIRLAELAAAHRIEELRISLEATGPCWFPLACALHTAPALAAYQPQICALNPRLVHDFRRNYGALPRSDRADAFVPPRFVDLRYAPVQCLTRYRMHLVQTLVREKSYFLTLLFLKFSGFCQSEPFGDPFGATSCAVLEEFTVEEMARAELSELAGYLRDEGRG